MSIAKSLEKTASKTIAKLGGEVTIRYVTAGSYNTTTGAITETTSDTDVKGVLQNVSVREVNELIQQGDKLLMIAAKDLPSTPGTKDRVVISSVVYQIIRVETVEQENTALTHELILRA